MNKASGEPATPLVSIVVPTYNCGATLEATLHSLAEQSWRDFEVVLSDGASSDGTVQTARSMAGSLPACTVLSRPDHGVYDAINLGIAGARGQWILILGGDDRLHAGDTLARVAPMLTTTSADAIYGDVRVMNPSRMDVPAGGRYAGPMPLVKLLRTNICQQAIFYRRSLFDELGGFEVTYKILADWAFNLRVAFRAPMVWVDQVIADYAGTGLSARCRDEAAERGIPELVRQELLRRAARRDLWPHHRALLRQADALRRRGRWADAARYLASYATLVFKRVAVLARLRR